MGLMPGLQEFLDGLDTVEFVSRIADLQNPMAVAGAWEDLVHAEQNWSRQKYRLGRVDIRARTHAIVAHDRAWWAVTRLHYAITKQPAASPASEPSAAAAASAALSLPG